MKKTDNEPKTKVRYPVRYPGKIGMFSTNQQNFGYRATEMRKSAGRTQKQLADQLGVSITSVQNYESGRIPNGEILVKLAAALDCTPEWLVTGEGEVKRGGGMMFKPAKLPNPEMGQAAPAKPETAATIYNDMGQPAANIADLVAKTIEVLQSQTVFQTALQSNIEAFHHAIVLEKKIDQVEDRIMAKISGRLDALESSNQRLEAENAQLRQELEQSRAESAVQNTG